MNLLDALIPFTVAAAVSWTLLLALPQRLIRWGFAAQCRPASMHSRVVPVGGGIAIWLGVAAAEILSGWLGHPTLPWPIYVAAGLLALIGLVDGHRGLPIPVRLVAQLIAASLVVSRLGSLKRVWLPEPFDVALGHFAFAATVLWIVAVTNFFNFMDGIDGFAGVQAIVAALVLALAPHNSLFLPMLAIAGATAGFLIHNWHPAKVFMGDVGSTVFGFLFAVIPLTQSHAREDAAWLVGLALWFFLSDGTFTLLKRAARCQVIWKPHREHLYQRLVRAHFRTPRIVLTVQLAGVTVAIGALYALPRGSSAQWMAMAAATVAFIAYALAAQKWGARPESNHPGD